MTNNTRWHELARTAYVSYGRTTDFKNFRGEPMPAFDDLPPAIIEAWKAAAQGIVAEVGMMMAGLTTVYEHKAEFQNLTNLELDRLSADGWNLVTAMALNDDLGVPNYCYIFRRLAPV